MDESLNYVQNFSNKKKSYLKTIYQKGKNLLPQVEQVFKTYHVPQELKMLIALESNFNANARSGAGAVGYWQFMDEAAMEYGLDISGGKASGKRKGKKKDDRTNFLKSTVAAAKYLRDRAHDLNNDLLLVVASYNWGIGNIWKAMKKTGLSNPGFWDIKKYLPAETKAYVMNFIALNVLFQNYDNFLKNQLVFSTQTVEVPISENVGKINTSVTD
jgi:membrane-bound lytic murein transglycosylase D